jgi:hypothetical protein
LDNNINPIKTPRINKTIDFMSFFTEKTMCG